jgi:hypothetical protein
MPQPHRHIDNPEDLYWLLLGEIMEASAELARYALMFGFAVQDHPDLVC